MLSNSDHTVLVAVENGRVVGWGHAYVRRLVESDVSAEVGGLVIDKEVRRSGAGRLLMQHHRGVGESNGVLRRHTSLQHRPEGCARVLPQARVRPGQDSARLPKSLKTGR